MYIQVVRARRSNRFRWEGYPAHLPTVLSVPGLSGYAQIYLIRDGQIIDRGLVTEPRGDAHYFSGFTGPLRRRDSHFLDLHARSLREGDALSIEFNHFYDQTKPASAVLEEYWEQQRE